MYAVSKLNSHGQQVFWRTSGGFSRNVTQAMLLENWHCAALVASYSGGDVTPIFAGSIATRGGIPSRKRAGSVTLALLLPVAMVGLLVASIAYSSGGTMQLGQLQQNWGQRISK